MPARPSIRIEDDLRAQRYVDAGDVTTIFDRVAVERVDFSGVTFAHLVTVGSRFVDCDFSRTRFHPFVSSADPAQPTTFIRCNFDRADLRGLTLRGLRFEQCTFRGSRINGWRGNCTEFVDCTFACRLEDVLFYGRPIDCFETPDKQAEVDQLRERLGIERRDHTLDAPRRSTNAFRGNDFSEATIGDVGFRCGIDIAAQLWPESGYFRFDRWPEREPLVRAQIMAWTDLDERSRALELVEVYWAPFLREQREVVLPLSAFQGWLGRGGVGDRVLELTMRA
jgi:hypothetical protein